MAARVGSRGLLLLYLLLVVVPAPWEGPRPRACCLAAAAVLVGEMPPPAVADEAELDVLLVPLLDMVKEP